MFVGVSGALKEKVMDGFGGGYSVLIIVAMLADARWGFFDLVEEIVNW